MTKPNENRRYFSISKEFEDVKDIIKNTSNASRYICEAIMEKYKRESENQFTNIVSKFDDIFNKIYDKEDLEKFIEFKIREIIQGIITANQVQLLMNPQLNLNNIQKVNTDLNKNQIEKPKNEDMDKDNSSQQENYEDILTHVNKNKDNKKKDDMRNRVNSW